MSRNGLSDLITKVISSITGIALVIMAIATYFRKQIEFSFLFSAIFIIIVWLFCLTLIIFKLKGEIDELKRKIE
jgi:ABC-type transport system involved in Fe-S cluster assembly fused permease/ATPase subunit